LTKLSIIAQVIVLIGIVGNLILGLIQGECFLGWIVALFQSIILYVIIFIQSADIDDIKLL